MADSTTVSITDVALFKAKALQWANHFETVCLLDSNNYPHSTYTSKNWVLAVGAYHELICGPDAFEKLKQFCKNLKSLAFGFLCYDLKNQIEHLESSGFDGLKFPDLYFFEPRYLIEIKDEKVTINRNYPETFELIELIQKIHLHTPPPTKTKLHPRTSKEQYIKNVSSIRQQIQEGDFYELNYCTEFFANDVVIDPVSVYQQLNKNTQAPFSCFFKMQDKYLLSSSPERFLKKVGNKLISQPIKGTIKKGKTTEENELLKQQLQNDAKERAENVMIVDLVRNDLSKSSKPGTTKVEDLFGIYEFNAVNQMISTVTSELREDVHPFDAIKNAFPMGSMTGAPKIEVMKNIERYEDFKRGLYSGSVGYITPDFDFDFNVVIRSILYNAADKYLSVRVGSAITFNSIAEKEYEEVLLKAQSMLAVLENN